jgi:hypothetical protein
MKKMIIVTTVILFPSLYGLAQVDQASPSHSASTPPVTREADNHVDEHKRLLSLWRDRAGGFTNASLEDGWHVRQLRPVLDARLADAWWKIDPVRAHGWLRQAIEECLHSSPNAPKEFYRRRLEAARVVFEIVNRYDHTSADKLLTMLMQGAIKESTDSPVASETANSIFRAAIQSADENDVRRVEQLGNQLLQLKDPGVSLSNVIFDLARKNPSAADSYFVSALNTAASTNDYYNVWDLVQYVLPIDSQLAPPSEAAKQQAINVAGRMLTLVPQDAQQATSYCQGAPRLADRVLSLLPPAQQGLTQAALQSCQNNSNDAVTKTTPHKCETADDCLLRAAQATTPAESATWKVHAARHARHENDLPRAVDILLSFTLQEKEATATWDVDYLNYCFEALQQLYRKRDTNRIQRMLDRSPDEVRPGVMLHFAAVLSAEKDIPYATSMLIGARASLEKHPVQNPVTYLELLNLYARLLPDDSPRALSFAVSGLNQITYPDFGKERLEGPPVGFRWGKPGERLEPISLSGVMVEKDEPYVVAALKGLDDPETRIAFRLTFLRYSLEQYTRERNRKPPFSTTDNTPGQSVSPK